MFSSDRNIETIGQLVEVLRHYIGLQSEYVRLDVVDKSTRLITAIAVALFIVTLLLVAMVYFSFAAAFALAPVVGMAEAFLLVGCFYLAVLILFFCFRHRWIERPLVKFLAGLLLQK